jgi:hypothetical protein
MSRILHRDPIHRQPVHRDTKEWTLRLPVSGRDTPESGHLSFRCQRSHQSPWRRGEPHRPLPSVRLHGHLLLESTHLRAVGRRARTEERRWATRLKDDRSFDGTTIVAHPAIVRDGDYGSLWASLEPCVLRPPRPNQTLRRAGRGVGHCRRGRAAHGPGSGLQYLPVQRDESDEIEGGSDPLKTSPPVFFEAVVR